MAVGSIAPLTPCFHSNGRNEAVQRLQYLKAVEEEMECGEVRKCPEKMFQIPLVVGMDMDIEKRVYTTMFF